VRDRLESCFYLCYCLLDLYCCVFSIFYFCKSGLRAAFPWFPKCVFSSLLSQISWKFPILSSEKLESLSPSRIYCFPLRLPRYPLLAIPKLSLPFPFSISSLSISLHLVSLPEYSLSLPLPSSPQAPQSLPKPHLTTPSISRLPRSKINILILFLPLTVREWS
jgi:hypothetical protein